MIQPITTLLGLLTGMAEPTMAQEPVVQPQQPLQQQSQKAFDFYRKAYKMSSPEFAKLIHPEQGLKYSTETPQEYGKSLEKFGQNINKIESSIAQGLSPEEAVYLNLPKTLQLLPSDKKQQAVQNYVTMRNAIQNTAKRFQESGINVAPETLLSQGAMESAFFKSPTGNLNFKGQKVNKNLRETLKTIYSNSNLEIGSDLNLPQSIAGISGAKVVQTNEILKSKNKEDAIKEAMGYNQFGQTWKLTENQKQPTIYQDDKNRWRVKIKDLFVNYETPEAALQQYEDIVMRIINQNKKR